MEFNDWAVFAASIALLIIVLWVSNTEGLEKLSLHANAKGCDVYDCTGGNCPVNCDVGNFRCMPRDAIGNLNPLSQRDAKVCRGYDTWNAGYNYVSPDMLMGRRYGRVNIPVKRMIL